MFNHIPISLPILETAHEEDKHFYCINGEKYPSITSILHSFPNEGIEIWKRKTPNWREIQQESFSVGAALHSKIESYLKNKDHDRDIELLPLKLYYNLKPELDKINNIRCQETYLYEHNLKVAGAVDCIAEYDGVLSVIDFKNSRKPKRESWIKDYKLQVTFYALAFKFCTGIEINQGVILIANWDGSTSTFKVNIPDYEDQLLDVLEQYEMLSMSK